MSKGMGGLSVWLVWLVVQGPARVGRVARWKFPEPSGPRRPRATPRGGDKTSRVSESDTSQ
jgi:hypothetical protein